MLIIFMGSLDYLGFTTLEHKVLCRDFWSGMTFCGCFDLFPAFNTCYEPKAINNSLNFRRFQLDSMLPATISTSICTLLCMMVVCFLFMYNIFTVVVATVSIVSICLGRYTVWFF